MSKSSELDQKVKTFLINSIDLSGYDIDASQLDTATKIEALNNIFMDEMGKFLIPKVGRQLAIKEWLSGIPSAINVPVYNDDILELAVSWGSLPPTYTDSQAWKIIENYFNFLAAKLCQLFDGYHVPKIESGE